MSNAVIYALKTNEIVGFLPDAWKDGSIIKSRSGNSRTFKPAVYGLIWTDDIITKSETGWSKTINEISPSTGLEIAKSSHSEVVDALSRRSQIANLSYEQVDNYVENTVTDLVSAKAFLKLLSKVVLAMIKIQDKE